MKIIVLDPRRGSPRSELLVMDGGDLSVRARLPLGYVPELVVDAVAREVVVVDTDLEQTNGVATRYWLKSFDAETLELKLEQEIPVRPMYAGFPGRSKIGVDPQGRFLYALQSTPTRVGSQGIALRITVNRYDRIRQELVPGNFHVDSCYVDFGCVGDIEERLYFHLSCDYPNTVALANFSSPDVQLYRMDDLAPRSHSPKETCGSWFDRHQRALYCVTGEGTILRVECDSGRCLRLLDAPLRKPSSIPLSQLCGGGGFLWLGVAANNDERGVGLASEVWQIDKANGGMVRTLSLPQPVLNFSVSPDGRLLAGVNPFDNVLAVTELEGGGTKVRDFPGLSPAEVIFVA